MFLHTLILFFPFGMSLCLCASTNVKAWHYLLMVAYVILIYLFILVQINQTYRANLCGTYILSIFNQVINYYSYFVYCLIKYLALDFVVCYPFSLHLDHLLNLFEGYAMHAFNDHPK